ncbi:uncharacterized protein N7496_008206 [Penicillium cataractarum]|uniref:DUF4291 domain-containing protein n=1 Tax=Penicillium cataractarum TaxID=2100454 RepID=A0A9W9RXZ6_9EURO|nr:uncharacterized protein N7496_008206 [Penicillium cataractarum]KAJ5368446.1 hypothetical protein N7496_008206 [Penicillium cataractarum]
MSTNPTIQSNSYRAIRATYTPTTITVYQAYSPEIANPALKAQTFQPPFSRTRMTWIKPSFLWMAYRCGWATKPRQERVLAIEMTRKGFEWALQHSCLSHWGDQRKEIAKDKDQWQQQLRDSPVRIQWDPERDLKHQPLEYRSIQIGLGLGAVESYVDEWIVSIVDVTDTMCKIREYLEAGDLDSARACLPEEKAYPLSEELTRILHASC